MWERDLSTLEWPRDLWKLALCFAGGLHEAKLRSGIFLTGHKARCVVYSSLVGGRGDGSPGTNLGSSAIWRHAGGDVGQDR